MVKTANFQEFNSRFHIELINNVVKLILVNYNEKYNIF